MNKFAEVYGGKIRDIKETNLDYVDFISLFSPKSYWIDVTGVTCEIGYVQEFKEGQGIVFVDASTVIPIVGEAETGTSTAVSETPEMEFQNAQTAKISFFGAEFAKRRDAITWAVQADGSVFGYDRKTEDVTNFLAAMQRAAMGLDTGFNVYVNNADEPKQFLPHTLKMFQDVLEQSAQEQVSAYQRYEAIKKQIFEECTTIDELNAITW